MSPNTRRIIAAAVILGTFVGLLLLGPHLIPGPMNKTEQMVVGALATLCALLAGYLFVLLDWFKPEVPVKTEEPTAEHTNSDS